MTQLIYIRTSYDKGLVMPMEVMQYISQMQIVKNSGYNDIKDLEADKEYRMQLTVINSNEIDEKVKLKLDLKNAKEDLESLQKFVEVLEEKV